MNRKNEEQLQHLVGKTVSILLKHKKEEGGDKYETYNGIIKKISNGLLVLDTNNPKFHIKSIYVDLELVISIWEYRMSMYDPNYKPREE